MRKTAWWLWKSQHLSLCFSEIVSRLNKEEGPFNRLFLVANKRFLSEPFLKRILEKFQSRAARDMHHINVHSLFKNSNFYWFPLKDLGFCISFKNLNIHIMIDWEKSSLHLTQCRINKGNTEQKIFDFIVCTNLENSSTRHQSNYWISFTFLNKVLILS